MADNNRCVICLEDPISHAFVPCGHNSACESCATQIYQTTKLCPMCRSNITSIMKIFKPTIDENESIDVITVMNYVHDISKKNNIYNQIISNNLFNIKIKKDLVETIIKEKINICDDIARDNSFDDKNEPFSQEMKKEFVLQIAKTSPEFIADNFKNHNASLILLMNNESIILLLKHDINCLVYYVEHDDILDLFIKTGVSCKDVRKSLQRWNACEPKVFNKIIAMINPNEYTNNDITNIVFVITKCINCHGLLYDTETKIE